MSKFYHKQLFLFAIVFINTVSNAYAQKFTEDEVKAVYLYQFAKFINWPVQDDSTATFVIGVYGTNNFASFSDLIFKDKLFKGRQGKIINISTAEQAKSCQIVYVSGIDKYSALKFINKINNDPVLIIGNQIPDFCQIGGMINFTPKDSKYRFEINPEMIKKSNLQVSSKLLSVGMIVSGKEGNF